MKNLKHHLTKNSLTKVAFALLTFVSRLGFLPANFSPVGPLGFFSKSLWPLILVTVGFDFLRGGFYSGFGWTYLGFLGYWLMGRLAKKSTKRQAVLLPVASFLFFALSNFGVWWGWYAHTLEGLITCYTLAIPFYRNTLLGDLAFGWGFLVVRSAVRALIGVKKNYSLSASV